MSKEVLLLTGAGQIGMAIARRVGTGKTIVVADKRQANAEAIAEVMTNAGFEAMPTTTDISSAEAVDALIGKAKSYGDITMFVNAAGVSPSQAPIETILKVDLYGTALLLEKVGEAIAPGGVGVTISSQSGHRMPALTPEQDELLALTPTEELLALPMLQIGSIRDTLHAYQMAKRCNVKRVMAEAVKWGQKGARINSISPGIIVTPLAIDEFKTQTAQAISTDGIERDISQVQQTGQPHNDVQAQTKKHVDQPENGDGQHIFGGDKREANRESNHQRNNPAHAAFVFRGADIHARAIGFKA